MTYISLTMKYHENELVTSEILDFEGHNYEEADYLGWICGLCSLVHNWE